MALSNPPFVEQALGCAKRALNLLDRSPFSTTYGCFDRYYWHFKMKDFPSSSYQMGSEYLARLWEFNNASNPHYRDKDLLKLCKASIDYTLSIQHKDGSFDEWYPNERGWAGPTSYVCHSLYASYKIIESQIDDAPFKSRVKEGLRRAGHFLVQRDEKEVLSNHFALYLLSLAEIIDLTDCSTLEQAYDSSLAQFFSYTSEEGWSLEYDGVDFGYNVATLSFFARLSMLKPDPRIVEYAQKSFRFLSYLMLPNGELGAGMGSRGTVHLYPLAFYYWSSQSKEAAALLQKLLTTDDFSKVLPSDQDDHYLFYRLSEYLEVAEYNIESGTEEILLPYECDSFKKSFTEAGLSVEKKSGSYVIINEKMGGAVSVAPIDDTKSIKKNFGWVVSDKRNQLYTSLWNGNYQIISSNNQSIVSGQGQRVFSGQFTPWKFILFRLATLILARFTLGAYYLKLLIRKILIVGRRPSPYKFCRKILIESDQLVITDEIRGLKRADRLFWGDEFMVRYVPQSRYISSDAEQFPQEIPLENRDVINIKETICLKTGSSTRCVQ